MANKAALLKPVDYYMGSPKAFKVFLAGSIEMGKAIDWQSAIYASCKAHCKKAAFFNPRRDDWDSSWDQSTDNANFYQQVAWEQLHMEKADLIVVYFDKDTKSPITLMELGLFAHTPEKLLVYCPEGFWRKGNVDIVCAQNDIEQVESLDELVKGVKARYDAYI